MDETKQWECCGESNDRHCDCAEKRNRIVAGGESFERGRGWNRKENV